MLQFRLAEENPGLVHLTFNSTTLIKEYVISRGYSCRQGDRCTSCNHSGMLRDTTDMYSVGIDSCEDSGIWSGRGG